MKMGKFLVCAFSTMLGISAFAAGGTYQVYKINLNVRTSDAKGVVASGCCGDGEAYCYRERRSVNIQGILAGCGCGAINADGVCHNAILYMWDATRGIAITNVTATIPWTVQRIGKKANVIEHFASFTAKYGEDDRYGFEITLSGFGKYNESTKDAELSYVGTIDGNFAGVATAPSYLKVGKCTACSVVDDEVYQTSAFDLCESCSVGLTESATADVTPFFGTYSVRYDSSKSKKIAKNGLNAKDFGLPKYMSVTDYVGTNIGE